MDVVAIKKESSLTDLDWRAVEIARVDGPRSINPQARFTNLLREFIGVPIARVLANDKLEALRRFCVRAWYWDFMRPRDMQLLAEAGYSSIAMLQILARVAGFRGFTPSLQQEPA